MIDEIRTKQQAYNAYAEAMEVGNSCSRSSDDEQASFWWEKAEEFWDLYLYWDESEY